MQELILKAGSLNPTSTCFNAADFPILNIPRNNLKNIHLPFLKYKLLQQNSLNFVHLLLQCNSGRENPKKTQNRLEHCHLGSNKLNLNKYLVLLSPRY